LKILITSATSARAYQLKNTLNTNEVLLGDYTDLPGFMLKKGNMIKLPDPVDAAYAHKILTLCLDHHIQAVYVLNDIEFAQLAKADLLFNEYDINIIWYGDEV